MSFDVPTLVIIATAVVALLALLLLLTWNGQRERQALAWWGTAKLVGAVGVCLIPLRGRVPDLVSIELANALVLIGYGVTWNGARVFDRRAPKIIAMGVAPLIWIAACQLPPFNSDINARIALISALIACLLSITARELWGGRVEALRGRKIAAVLFCLYAAFMLVRGTLTFVHPLPNTLPLMATGWIAAATLGTLLFTIVIAFLFISLVRERTELAYKTASLVDPLTGLANRRAFLDGGTRHLMRQARRGGPLAVLVADLDHFKCINDEYGHAVGDHVLQLFADTLGRDIRPGDIAGRLGGEEFAVVLPGCDLAGAIEVAERIRTDFGELAAAVSSGRVAATVSIGVTATTSVAEDLADLIMVADRALYRAKFGGRNRVVALDLDRRPEQIDAPSVVPSLGAAPADAVAHPI